MIAVDASVAVKWLWPEPGNDEADALLRSRQRLLAPSCLRLEVAAAILRRRLETMPSDDTRQRYQQWLQMLQADAVALVPDAELLDRAADLALQLSLPLTDCLYLAVAQHYRIPLITADPTFHDRARSVQSDVSLLLGQP
jgi:predicted nucleic acid-binding protein